MRQIKFRGQRVDTKEWVYGDVIHYDSGEIKILEQNYRIWDILEGAYEVIPESVGQFTGLKDNNGVDCYEGDKSIIDGNLCVVRFSNYFLCGWEFNIIDGIGCYSFADIVKNVNGLNCKDFEIIGNIHNNRELVK